MLCASCGANNPDAYKHCGTCGAALEVPPAEFYPNYAPEPIYGYPTQARQSSSRRTRILFVGVLVVGLVMLVMTLLTAGLKSRSAELETAQRNRAVVDAQRA